MTARRKGTDAADREQPGAAEEIGREEPCEQRSVQAVDGGRSQAHVEIAASLIRLKDLIGARIRAAVHHRVAKSRNVAQAEIETLRTDGREHVRRLSDEGEAGRVKAIDRETAHGDEPARPVDTHPAENGLRLTLDRERQRIVGKRSEAFRFRRARHPDEARPATGQGHERERARGGCGTPSRPPGAPVRGRGSSSVRIEDRSTTGRRCPPPDGEPNCARPRRRPARRETDVAVRQSDDGKSILHREAGGLTRRDA